MFFRCRGILIICITKQGIAKTCTHNLRYFPARVGNRSTYRDTIFSQRIVWWIGQLQQFTVKQTEQVLTSTDTQSDIGTTVFMTMAQEKKTRKAMTTAPEEGSPGTSVSHGRYAWKYRPTSHSHTPHATVQNTHIDSKKNTICWSKRKFKVTKIDKRKTKPQSARGEIMPLAVSLIGRLR